MHFSTYFSVSFQQKSKKKFDFKNINYQWFLVEIKKYFFWNFLKYLLVKIAEASCCRILRIDAIFIESIYIYSVHYSHSVDHFACMQICYSLNVISEVKQKVCINTFISRADICFFKFALVSGDITYISVSFFYSL